MPLPQQNSVFIDPENCGSSVGYYITINEYTPEDKVTNYSLSGTVVLTNCSHKIDWSFGNEKDGGKIEEAIRMLQEFSKKFKKAQKLVAKLNK